MTPRETATPDRPRHGNDDPPVLDGRHQRRVKTRQAIIAAVIGLQEEGGADAPGPATANAIAARAGVSLRSIFTHFPTQDALTLAVMDELDQRLMHNVLVHTPEGDLAQRLDRFLPERVALLEALVAYRRAAAAMASSPAVSQRRRAVRKRLRKEMAVVLAPEIAALAPAERTMVLDAASVLCESEAWDSLRRYYGLSAKAAQATMRLGVEKLLAVR